MGIIKTNITGIGDPFILPYEGVYYHYSTSHEAGFIVRTSTDLVHWDEGVLCYQDSKVGFKDFWAPEVYFYRDQFYMFFSSKNKEQDRLLMSVAVSKNPRGPFIDVSDKPTFDFGYAAIDASVFFDDDGKIYMYYAKDCSENMVDGIHTSQIYVIELSEDLIHTKGKEVLVSTPKGPFEQRDPNWQWNEGPSLLKENGIYYLSYSTNCFSDKLYSVCYKTSKSPLGPFVKAKNNPVLTYIEDEISGPGHNCYFQTFDNQKMTAFHIHTDILQPSGDRRTCFSKYHIKNNQLVIEYN